MDLGLAFSFPFKDEKWIEKIVIAALISIIPIIGWFALLGWSIEIGRRVINGEEQVLADWSDFGGLLTLGFKAWVAALVFSIPLLLVWIPVGIFWAIAGSADGDAAAVIISLVTFCIVGFTFIYGIALMFALPASYGRLASTDGLGDALNFGELWKLVSNAPGAYLIVLLGYIVAGFIASLGSILCLVGVFLTTAYALAVEGHLLGQAYLEGTAEA
ncbi:MAG: DUF4013 domain-containing protein [Anaerolineae bacterium]|nr:MAG: DUF4013 domain-containing protein [Anaerolineae bacterium]